MLYVIIGKSSTGKDTIYKKLINDKELNLKTIVTYTTRPIRENEVEGREYHFTDRQKLNEFEKNGKVIERRTYDTVYGEWDYFTVDEGVDIKNDNYIIIGTLESYEKFLSYYGDENVCPLYIVVEDGVRLKRAMERESQQNPPKYSEMCRRYLADEEDFKEENLKRLRIERSYYNDKLDECVKNIKSDIS